MARRWIPNTLQVYYQDDDVYDYDDDNGDGNDDDNDDDMMVSVLILLITLTSELSSTIQFCVPVTVCNGNVKVVLGASSLCSCASL